MKRPIAIRHEFVKSIPEALAERTLYVSMEYATVAHKCCCGCGKEVVTPLSPTDWKLTYDGVSVSLHPSIGNWSFACQSHYWIKDGIVRWAEQWSKEEIEAGRARDRRSKENHYGAPQSPASQDKAPAAAAPGQKRRGDFWSRLTGWWPR